MYLENIEEQKKINRILRSRILKVLAYIDEVMDEDDNKELSIIRDELLGSSLSHLPIRGEAKPPRDNNLFAIPCIRNCCELGILWKRRIRLFAEKMNRLNLKKNP